MSQKTKHYRNIRKQLRQQLSPEMKTYFKGLVKEAKEGEMWLSQAGIYAISHERKEFLLISEDFDSHTNIGHNKIVIPEITGYKVEKNTDDKFFHALVASDKTQFLFHNGITNQWQRGAFSMDDHRNLIPNDTNILLTNTNNLAPNKET